MARRSSSRNSSRSSSRSSSSSRTSSSSSSSRTPGVLTGSAERAVRSQIANIQSGINQLASSQGKEIKRTSNGGYEAVNINQPTPEKQSNVPKPMEFSDFTEDQQAIQTPTKNQPNFMGTVVANQSQLDTGLTEMQKYEKDQTSLDEGRIKDMLGIPRVNAEKIYNQSGAQDVENARREVNNYSGQINTIVSQAQADTLAVTGQGRGIPEVIIGGQQAQINKEAAIKALPLQALMANAQGNLELAQQHLDTVFKLKMADAQAEYDFRTKLVTAVYDNADKKQQRLLDQINLKENRAYQEQQQLNADGQSYAKMAFANGQSSLGAKIAGLDVKSPTYKADLTRLISQLRDPAQELAMALKSGGGSSNGSVGMSTGMSVDPAINTEADAWAKNINAGRANFSDIKDETVRSLVSQKLASIQTPEQESFNKTAKEKVATIENLLTAPGLKSSIGPNPFGRASFTNLVTASKSNFISSVEQLTNKETLDTLLSLKKGGGTLGAVNEKEFSTLQNAATRINNWAIKDETGKVVGYKTTETEFVKELNKIKESTQKLITDDSVGNNKILNTDSYYLNSLKALQQTASTTPMLINAGYQI